MALSRLWAPFLVSQQGPEPPPLCCLWLKSQKSPRRLGTAKHKGRRKYPGLNGCPHRNWTGRGMDGWHGCHARPPFSIWAKTPLWHSRFFPAASCWLTGWALALAAGRADYSHAGVVKGKKKPRLGCSGSPSRRLAPKPFRQIRRPPAPGRQADRQATSGTNATIPSQASRRRPTPPDVFHASHPSHLPLASSIRPPCHAHANHKLGPNNVISPTRAGLSVASSSYASNQDKRGFVSDLLLPPLVFIPRGVGIFPPNQPGVWDDWIGSLDWSGRGGLAHVIGLRI